LNKTIVRTGDGSHTIFVPELNEHYHSINGAITESRHIYINAGFNFCLKKQVNILEIGFGTGLNSLLTFMESKNQDKEVFYHTYELFPLSFDLFQELNYPDILNIEKALYLKFHICEWEKKFVIDKNFTLLKTNLDAVSTDFPFYYDLVYFDAFAPGKQQDIWNKTIFGKIFDHMNNEGILVTFSTNGLLKRNLKEIGFYIELLPGPPGKRNILRAIKKS
jgi:tRNA U34 5-methylaminomethyl-2-thiouridine-forming methyltransferase MnmC